MKQTKILMGMPVTIEIVDRNVKAESFVKVFKFLNYIDRKFSTFKKNSEISKMNRGKIKSLSIDMKKVLLLSEKTKRQSNGYFNIKKNNYLDPSGLVKGWAIYGASEILKKEGYRNFYVFAGGDIQTFGKNKKGKAWKVGIQNPFSSKQIVKVVYLKNNEGVATSGNYERGEHIYNPKGNSTNNNIVSLTVIGPNIFDADRFATAAFAMGQAGIRFIDQLKGFEGYMIDKTGIATLSCGFANYVSN